MNSKPPSPLTLALTTFQLFALAIGCHAQETAPFCRHRLIAYYPDYDAHRRPIDTIRYNRLTHLVYFSLAPNANGSLDTSQIDLQRQSLLVQTAHEYNVQVIICVGGWGLCQHFPAVAANLTARAAFIDNLHHYALEHNFDGVDLDWEPVTSSTDRDNYTTLLTELHTLLAPDQLSLSVAVAALGSEFNAPAIPCLDWVGVMAYDMGNPHAAYNDALAALDHWQSRGVPPKKLILGVPFYGRNDEGSYLPYRDIVATYHPAPDLDEIAGYNFNGIDTVKRKTKYILNNNYAGLMFWELTLDNQYPSSLLAAAANTCYRLAPPDLNCDDLIDPADLALFANHWLQGPCSPENAWCHACDRDLSGLVNLADLAQLCNDWLK